MRFRNLQFLKSICYGYTNSEWSDNGFRAHLIDSNDHHLITALWICGGGKGFCTDPSMAALGCEYVFKFGRIERYFAYYWFINYLSEYRQSRYDFVTKNKHKRGLYIVD